MPGHRRCFVASKLWPDMALHKSLDLFPSAQSIPTFDMLGKVAIEQIVHQRRIDIGAPVGNRIVSIANLFEFVQGELPGFVSGDLAVLAERKPPRSALNVTVLH